METIVTAKNAYEVQKSAAFSAHGFVSQLVRLILIPIPYLQQYICNIRTFSDDIEKTVY